MSNFFIEDFENRIREINTFFLFLKRLEDETVKLQMKSSGGVEKIQPVKDELLKTLKANSFLLLYSLVESTMRNAIEAIFDAMNDQEITFDSIRPELREIVLKNLSKKNPEKISKEIDSISIDIIHIGFDRKLLFSGNLDARKIRKTAKDYGFSSQTDNSITRDGYDLLTVKENRNNLAHGHKTFSEVGREKSANELLQIKNRVYKYLKQILNNINDYIVNREYENSDSLDSSH